MSASRYRLDHIILHWLIAFLVALQLIFGEGMSRAFDAMMEGGGSGALTGQSLVHGGSGSLILVLVLYRLAIRMRAGVPPPPQASRAVQIAGRANHWAFYGLLVIMPLAGLIAWYGRIDGIATAHAIASKVLLALIAAHLAGVLYHHFVKRDKSVIHRMAPTDAAATEGRTDA